MKRSPHRWRILRAYPTQCNDLRNFVNSLRNMYFPDKGRHEPYISVFYTYTFDLETLANHIQRTSSKIKAFAFTMRCAIVQASDIAGFTINLVADEGLQNFLAILSLLDNGNLQNHHPGNYIPSILIGWTLGLEEASQICRQINQAVFEYSGIINTLTISESTAQGFQDRFTTRLK